MTDWFSAIARAEPPRRRGKRVLKPRHRNRSSNPVVFVSVTKHRVSPVVVAPKTRRVSRGFGISYRGHGLCVFFVQPRYYDWRRTARHPQLRYFFVIRPGNFSTPRELFPDGCLCDVKTIHQFSLPF